MDPIAQNKTTVAQDETTAAQDPTTTTLDQSTLDLIDRLYQQTAPYRGVTLTPRQRKAAGGYLFLRNAEMVHEVATGMERAPGTFRQIPYTGAEMHRRQHRANNLWRVRQALEDLLVQVNDAWLHEASGVSRMATQVLDHADKRFSDPFASYREQLALFHALAPAYVIWILRFDPKRKTRRAARWATINQVFNPPGAPAWPPASPLAALPAHAPGPSPDSER